MLEDKLKTFQKNIDWFKANYGAPHFSTEMCSLIWEELKEFSPKQIDSLFHKIIGESEFTPKVGTFRTWAASLREKLRQHDREQERRDSQDFWSGKFHTSEQKAIVETIRLRMNGKVTDSEWEQFMATVKRASEDPKPKCTKCDDTGAYLDAQYRQFKCHHVPAPIIKTARTQVLNKTQANGELGL